ncbi:MAG: flavodoxin FldA [Mediterranea sp.]|jgi:flavodoxin I|nr:flavodoxin FldA [Mediterranea sp.]
MSKIGVIYGSSTGTTEDVARRIAAKVGVANADLHDVSKLTEELLDNYGVLLLGTATWGSGELQDDWYDGVKILKKHGLAGKTVALFGCGDSGSYPDTFCGGMGELYAELKDTGARFVGATPVDGYEFDDSPAVVDGQFVGLPLDEANEYDKTDARIDAWYEQVKGELN